MDKLKQILKTSKPTSKLIQQKQILQDQKNRQFQHQKQQKRKQEQMKQKRIQQLQQFYEYDIKRKKVKVQLQLDKIGVSNQQIMIRLRSHHQPIKLFAESDPDRYKRLLKIEAFYKDHPNFDMKNYDEEFQQKLKQQEEFNQLDAKYRDRLIEPRLGDDLSYIKKKMEIIIKDGQNVAFENMCDEIYLWINKILRDWYQILEQKYNTEQSRQMHHDNFAKLQDSSNQIKSFLYVLKNRGGNKDMIRSIYHIMNCCLVRQYIQANDKYIDLSIGNAAWPMGIAMLSITVRRNGPKVSHVLDEQMSRRWMLTIKRLISICQQIYPNQQQHKKVGYSVRSLI